jgi:hypothetical protein
VTPQVILLLCTGPDHTDPVLTRAEANELLGDDSVHFVDIRDVRELQREGKVPGAFHATRGMLEFWNRVS